MFEPKELRAIADFVEKVQSVFEDMTSFQPIEIYFDEEVVGAYTINRPDGTPLGSVQITDSGDYEFVPAKEE